MIEFLLYMAVPNACAAFFIWMLWIRPSRLQQSAFRLLPLVLAITAVAYLAGETGVCVLKPWFFDCSKTVGLCVCGLPIEDVLVSFCIVLNVALATLAFSQMEKKSNNFGEFLSYLLLLKKP